MPEQASNPAETISSPPASETPQPSALDETRQRLLQLASELIRTRNRKLLVEFLTLRRLAH